MIVAVSGAADVLVHSAHIILDAVVWWGSRHYEILLKIPCFPV